MIKKQQAHRGEKGINVTARGYAMKARPGPKMQQGISESFSYINADVHLIQRTCSEDHHHNQNIHSTKSHAKPAGILIYCEMLY